MNRVTRFEHDDASLVSVWKSCCFLFYAERAAARTATDFGWFVAGGIEKGQGSSMRVTGD